VKVIHFEAFFEELKDQEIRSSSHPYSNLQEFFMISRKYKDLLLIGKVEAAMSEFSRNQYLQLFGVSVYQFLNQFRNVSDKIFQKKCRKIQKLVPT
jgi:hypothetical protein